MINNIFMYLTIIIIIMIHLKIWLLLLKYKKII